MQWRIAAAVFALLLTAVPASAQTSRDATRESLRGLLTTAGQRSDVNVTFQQSTKNPYNFFGSMKGFTYSDSLECVVSVTKSDTVGFRIYPHYHSGYINIKKAKNPSALMTKLLLLSDLNFLFWGADDNGDVFAGYTITLESGFPSDAMLVVLRSIRNTDKFVGEMAPYI